MISDTSDTPTQLGNYDVLAKIAEGGMGTVYKARHRFTGEVVAVKVISPGTNRSPVILQRFEQEFRAAKVLDHPNVVRAIEYCGSGPHPFLVMEFVDGESIGQRVEREGAIPEAEAVRLTAQVCDGLQRAHKQGLVHRDVKPDNILVTREGVAKLTDMGLVKEVDGDLNLTKTGKGLGTPHYMAPEQFRNAKGVDVRGDIYSIGATLYAMVTGTVPFANSNPLDCWMRKIKNEFPPPKELNPALSDRVDWAIRRAMSAEPSQRPASCREFLEDLTGQSRGSGSVKPAAPNPAEVWYMVYRDETGQSHTVKGGTDSIRSALREGLLGDASTILVGRTKTGQFLPLMSIPEFRDLVVAPAPLPPSGRSSTVPPVSPGRGPGEDAVDLGGLPPAKTGASASRVGKGGPASGRYSPQGGGPASGRYAPQGGGAPAGRYTPQGGGGPTPPPGTPRPKPTASPRGPAPISQPPPTANPGWSEPATPTDRINRPEDGRYPRGKSKSFDWTPILMVVVAILSAAIGYFLFMR